MKQAGISLRGGWVQASILSCLAVLVGFGCAQADKDADLAGRQATESTVVEFDQGQAYLSQDARQQIQEAVNEFRSNGTIEQVSVAVWSDNEFPAEGQELPESQRELAEQRISNIEQYVEDQLGAGDVTAYNMAEHAGWWASTFNTEEEELKSDFARRGEAQVEDPTFQHFHNEGEPSKAVIVIEGQKYDQAEGMM